VALAGLAAAAFNIERETSGFVAAGSRLRQHRVELAYRREQASVGRRIRSRSTTDGRLVDLDDLVDKLESLDPIIFERLDGRLIYVSIQRRIKYFLDQRRFTGPGHARNTDKEPERKLDIDIFQIVAAG